MGCVTIFFCDVANSWQDEGNKQIWLNFSKGALLNPVYPNFNKHWTADVCIYHQSDMVKRILKNNFRGIVL